MENIKQLLLGYAQDAKKTDLKENESFWDDIILTINESKTEDQLFKIGQEYFALEQWKK